ncbi:hypothetical protein [Bartonella phoceensis]|uniref:hypothetical protein n=1 Tax=Bartonella phoceensis TaxID=270249 RepID=UPI001ABB2AFB|nr:hypothetical protein [Bartonella phoceensis]
MFKSLLPLFFLFTFVICTKGIIAKETEHQFEFPYIVANYSLTENFLLKMEKITKECENLPPELKATNTIYNHSIEGIIDFISHKPKLMYILRKNDITPKEFAIGSLALRATLIILTRDISFEKEGISFDEKNAVVLDNLEFGKKHMYRIFSVLGKSCE